MVCIYFALSSAMQAKVGAGNDCAVHLLTDSFGYLRARGYQICTPRHADIFDFKRKFKDFLAEFEKGWY